MPATLMPTLERRLKAERAGEVRFDAFTRGRYATDASHYQMMPVGVVIPRTVAEAERAIALARSDGVSVLARGGGTSQAGQTVNNALVIDCSKHLNRILDIDPAGRRCTVEPGIVLDELNRALRPHGLWFPVDISTASRATIGGMVANNSCGTRSLRYGITRDNVNAVEAMMADGTRATFGRVSSDLSDLPAGSPLRGLAADLFALGAREADEIAARFPKVQRRVGGYNLDALVPWVARSDAKPGATFADRAPAGRNDLNLAHILIGSEGTLAFTTQVELALAPLLGRRTVGACHFGSFQRAMEAAQHIVRLQPIAVELIDRTMLGLARDIAMFAPTLAAFVRGDPEAILLVEFGEDDEAENEMRLRRLHDLIGDLGLAWDKAGAQWGGVVDVRDARLQAAITEVRTAGLNIMMSMKEAGKPVSFVEDCAVPLEHLADYTARLTQVFEKHGTRGTWYAHAAVGCLHVRPVLNLHRDTDVAAMRAIAEEAFAFVRAYKGAHSGEHGDGIVRSEFHAAMFGDRLVRAFEAVKDRFDPHGLFNPGKIVRAPKFDDRAYFRYGPDYRAIGVPARLDWSAFPAVGAGGGFLGAVEMCNNNGACRQRSGGVMCPSYRVTRDEADVTRGRANTLRLALTGQLGPDALTAPAMAETMKLCVSCKACRRECPTGVDMARMKIEVQAAHVARHGLSLRDRLIGFLPRYAPLAVRLRWLLNLRDRLPGAAVLTHWLLGFGAQRRLPRWRGDVFDERSADSSLPRLRGRDGVGVSGGTTPPPGSLRDPTSPASGGGMGARRTRGENGTDVVLFADTFNRYFERENLDAALTVLRAGGYRVQVARPASGSRPLCCGRTFLSVGLVEEARREAARTIEALAPYVARGVPIVGLEPSCILGFRDEIPSLVGSEDARRLADLAVTFEEFVLRETRAGRLDLRLKPIPRTALVHGHCHQKAFGVADAVADTLRLVPDLAVEPVESSCCGMAGGFGYGADTYDVSIAMGELSLLPAVRGASADALIVADGTSCRSQIEAGAGRRALHATRILAMSLAAGERP